MIFVSCPACGQKLLEGEAGSRVRLKCNKCGGIVEVKLEEAGVNLTVKEKKEACV